MPVPRCTLMAVRFGGDTVTLISVTGTRTAGTMRTEGTAVAGRPRTDDHSSAQIYAILAPLYVRSGVEHCLAVHAKSSRAARGKMRAYDKKRPGRLRGRAS